MDRMVTVAARQSMALKTGTYVALSQPVGRVGGGIVVLM